MPSGQNRGGGQKKLDVVGNLCEVAFVLDIATLAERYPQFQGHETAVEAFLERVVRLRRHIIELESPKFDDSRTQGMRFFNGLRNLVGNDECPEGLSLVDFDRGVLALFDVPFKSYRPDEHGLPRHNKTRIADREKVAIIEQLDLPGIPAELRHNLLRVEVDTEGDPIEVWWEEWEGRMCIWQARIWAEEAPAPLVNLAPHELPPPAMPLRPPVGSGLGEVVDGTEGDDEPSE